jgi:hypothetical protein
MRVTIVILAAAGVLILVRVVPFTVAPLLVVGLAFGCLAPSLLALLSRADYRR